MNPPVVPAQGSTFFTSSGLPSLPGLRFENRVSVVRTLQRDDQDGDRDLDGSSIVNVHSDFDFH